MTRRTASQAQRARRLLNQEAMKRSHRRSDLIRIAPEDALAASAPQTGDDAPPKLADPVTDLSSS